MTKRLLFWSARTGTRGDILFLGDGTPSLKGLPNGAILDWIEASGKTALNTLNFSAVDCTEAEFIELLEYCDALLAAG